MPTPHHKWLESDEGSAWAALQWCCGRKQHDIGVELGYSSGVRVNVYIGHFLERYLRTAVRTRRIYGVERRRLVPMALAEYVRRGGEKPRLRMRAAT